MHVMEIITLRPIPAAGLFLSLTRRCPLTCAHCSTNSLMTSEEYAERIFLRFVETFTSSSRPQVLMLTGGEALLRPKLVQKLIEHAHAVGTRVSLTSGMFFARQHKIPPAIERAIAGLDHFTASLDIFHEQQVPRADVFRVLKMLVDRGQDVSIQVVGLDENDPYLADVTADIQRTFNNRVPAYVAPVNAVGRAREWLEEHPEYVPLDIAPQPCGLATWPVMTYDGTLIACCNQEVVDGPVPPHLRLGHAMEDDWATISKRLLRSNLLRAIRVFGPEYIADHHSAGKVRCDGYCSTCYRLSDDPEIVERLEPLMGRQSMSFVEQQLVNIQQKRSGFGIQAYQYMLGLGYDPERRELCVN